MISDRGDAPVAVCVLGPGRSGTSLTMRLLGLAGVDLGSERELVAGSGIAANPRGFWENRRMVELNERILAAFGGSWDRPPRLANGWERSERLAAEREQARALIERNFAGRRLWGWKDPRCSLTLPFWQGVLADSGCELRCVICLRNPVDLAASLAAFDSVSPRRSFEIWLSYTASAMVNTADLPRILQPYERYFDAWRDAVGALASFAGCEMPAPGSEAEREMREFTDEGLWHHRTAPGRAMRDVSLPQGVGSLYALAELLAADPNPSMAEAVNAYARSRLLVPQA